MRICPLHDLRRVGREELLARAARHARQRLHGPPHAVAQAAHVDARTAQQKGRQRIVLADERREDVERLDSLLSPLLRQGERRLQRLLRLDGQTVDVHTSVIFVFRPGIPQKACQPVPVRHRVSRRGILSPAD